ncbi:MAG: phosphohydrolase [Lachnospiraceae bacterium]
MKRAEKKRLIAAQLLNLNRQGNMLKSRGFCQHGKTTVYQHSINVAYCSLTVAQILHLKVCRDGLIRGALLHDYFLYDWHEKDKSHRFHGFRHPKTALHNAKRDFLLSEVEENIIARHMFPLLPVPPTYKESWIVCLVDKGCSTYEIVYQGEKANEGERIK